MLSILKQNLIGTSLLNPWVILAVVAALVSSHSYVGYKAYSLGGAQAQLACEIRVKEFKDAIEKKQSEIKLANEEWQKRIDSVTESFNAASKSRQDQVDKLEQEVTDYEKTLDELRKVPGSVRGCRLDRRDL